MQRRHPGDGHADGGELRRVGEVDARCGEDHVLVVDLRVALDLGDVAALDLPAGVGVRRHLPLQVGLHARYAVDQALVLHVAAAEGPLGQLVPAQVDVLGAGAQLVGEDHLVELEAEAVGLHVDRVGEHRGVLLEHRRQVGVVHGEAVADLAPGVGRVVARDVDGLDRGDVLDVRDVRGADDAEDLVEPRVHPRAVERRAAPLARRGEDLAHRAARVVRMVGVAVEAGDPVRGGDDVDPGLEDAHVEVLVGEHPVEGHDVGPRGDDLLDRPGGGDADRLEAGELADVASDLVR